jgi:outer membrane cobalamin receptor
MALDYEVRPTDRIGFTIGALHHWLEGDGVSDAAAGVSAGMTVSPDPATRLRASAAHRFRFPTLRQLYDRDGGNPELDTERADLLELGVERQVGRLATVGLTLFHTSARDFIERVDGSELYQNAERYRFQGFEVLGTLRPIPAAFLRLGYSFLDAEDRSPGREGVTLQYRPRHKVTGEARWSARWGLDASLTLQHLAGQVYHSRRLPLQVADLPDYTVVGLRLAQRIPRIPIGVYAGVDNLFDEPYEQSYGFPQAGRIAYVGLDLEP